MKTKLLFLLPLAAIVISCGPSQEDLLKKRVEGLSAMAELGTVEYTVKKIIRSDDPRITLGDKIKVGDRKILFSCTAHLKAGVDLKNITMDNVIIDNASNSITVTLPHAKLLSFNMPSEEIVEEFVSVTKFRDNFTPKEKIEFLQQGEADILQDVDNIGILADAEANASSFLKAMLASFGYSSINVIFE